MLGAFGAVSRPMHVAMVRTGLIWFAAKSPMTISGFGELAVIDMAVTQHFAMPPVLPYLACR